MDLWLEIEAEAAEVFAIEATGRDAAIAGSVRGNLILETYQALVPGGPALRLKLRNGIPLGMGCGSSAAALLAGVHLAHHFGELGWTPGQVLAEACRREGHPDNVAACFHGGFTVSATERDGEVRVASFAAPSGWRLLLALPRQSLSTAVARSLLPETYSRADAVSNVQATALLVAAFAQGRADLLLSGTRDRLHQPYRAEACPLLPHLLPLAGTDGVLSVTLSGAGPSVLLIVDAAADLANLRARVAKASGELQPEIVETRIAGGAEVIAGLKAMETLQQVTEDTLK